jgi:hypothetical protein
VDFHVDAAAEIGGGFAQRFGGEDRLDARIAAFNDG